MPLIDGVGDEVVQFMAVVLVVLIAALAWWSTNARPDRYRTVLVMRSRSHHPVTVSIRPRATLMVSNTQTNNSAQQPPPTDIASPSTPVAEEPIETTTSVIPLQEMDSIVDADMAMLDNNRLHFYRRIDSPSEVQSGAEPSEESEVQEESEPASHAQIREMDSIVNAMEADVNTTCECVTQQPTSASPTDAVKTKNERRNSEIAATASSATNLTSANQGPAGDDASKILIKLKYLNDTLKEVEGNLDELLKDFKWRHFSSELSSECRVRLIFNGRVLLDDAATLRACGLHHRAVVHCLVHPKRSNSQPRGQSDDAPMNATHELITEGAPPERAWDLENILMTLVSVALTVVWFFRCEYSNMFTASASVALFGLTVFYSVAIFGLYLSDTFHIERRPVPPAAPAQPNIPAATPPLHN